MDNMLETDKMMVEDGGAEFRIGKMYYKHINGKLYRSKADSEEWQTAYIQELTWKGASKIRKPKKRGEQYEK